METHGSRLAGKVVLLSGEFSPFGAETVHGVASNEWAIAVECARAGAAVMVADRDARLAGDVADALRRSGYAAASVACDVASSEDCHRAVGEAVARFGGLHLLINTVGAPDMKTVETIGEEEFETLLGIHLVGNLRLLKAALAPMRAAGGGAVVTISSLSAIRTGGAGIGYETAKAGLLAMTRNVALSEAAANIRVNAVLPGALDSAAFRQIVGPDTSDFARRIPVGRLGTPQDLARAVVFLLSDDAAFITGAGLLVDGGMAWPV